MHLLHVLKYIAILFAGGVATSYAEYKFNYSLYQTLKALLPSRKK